MTRTTRSIRHINATPDVVYQLLTDPGAVRRWRVPEGMSSHIHEFDAREGGAFRVSLTYHSPVFSGKTSEHTDTYHGHFVSLVPTERVVEVMEFETGDPAMRGEMTVTYVLSASAGGTDLVAEHEDIPPGVPLSDNELGWRMALDNLAVLAESFNDDRDIA